MKLSADPLTAVIITLLAYTIPTFLPNPLLSAARQFFLILAYDPPHLAGYNTNGVILCPIPIKRLLTQPNSLVRPLVPAFLFETLLKKMVKLCIFNRHTSLNPRNNNEWLLLP